MAVMLPLSTQKFSQLNHIENYSDSLNIMDICKQSLHITQSHGDAVWPASAQTRM